MDLKVNNNTGIKNSAKCMEESSCIKQGNVPNEQLRFAIAQANKIGEFLGKRLSFDIDMKTDNVIVKIKDKGTGKVVRVVPPVEMIRIAAHLKQLKILNNKVIDPAESVILDHKC